MEERNGALSGDLAEDVTTVPLERLEAEITSLNAHLSAATCRWLVFVGEFDRRAGHETWGCYDMAQYLGWKCGVDRRTAREHVRVARALPGLPKTLDSFSRGELSYSKVRAITRVATPENEEALVDWARHGTASHLERIVRSYGTVLRNLEMRQVNERHARRSVRCHRDDDGSTVLVARLDPEAAAVVMAALAAMEKLQTGSAEPRVTSPFTAGRAEADARLGLDLAPDAGRCRWGGENLDLDCATDALWCLDGRRERERRPSEAA